MSRISIVPPKPPARQTLQHRGALLLSSTPRERAERLDATRWAHRLSWKEEEGIGLYLEYFRLPAGTFLFKEGDHDAFAAIITSGALEIRKGDSSQQMRTVAHLTEGKMVGEMSLIDGAARSATAVATEQTEILVLSREDFDQMCEARPDIALKFTLMVAEAVSQLLRKTTGTLVDHLELRARDARDGREGRHAREGQDAHAPRGTAGPNEAL